MKDKFSILIVDNDPQMAETFRDNILHLLGYETVVAFSGEEAMEKIKKTSFNFLITNIRMPQMNGVDLCRAAKLMQPDIPVVMMTAYANEMLIKDGLDAGAVSILQKPLVTDSLISLVSMLNMEKKNLNRSI